MHHFHFPHQFLVHLSIRLMAVCWDRVVMHCPGWLKLLSSNNPLASFSQAVTTTVMCNHAWSSIPYWLSTLWNVPRVYHEETRRKHTACFSLWQWRAEWIHSNQVWTPVMRLGTITTHTCVYRVICELRRSTKFVEKFVLYTKLKTAATFLEMTLFN